MRLILASAATLALAACATTPGGQHGSRERLVYIAAEKAPCSAGATEQCLQFREEPKQPWQVSQAPVENFAWKPGNEYLVKITEIEVSGPAAGGSRVRWRVDKIVEQHAADKPPLP